MLLLTMNLVFIGSFRNKKKFLIYVAKCSVAMLLTLESKLHESFSVG